MSQFQEQEASTGKQKPWKNPQNETYFHTEICWYPSTQPNPFMWEFIHFVSKVNEDECDFEDENLELEFFCQNTREIVDSPHLCRKRNLWWQNAASVCPNCAINGRNCGEKYLEAWFVRGRFYQLLSVSVFIAKFWNILFVEVTRFNVCVIKSQNLVKAKLRLCLDFCSHESFLIGHLEWVSRSVAFGLVTCLVLVWAYSNPDTGRVSTENQTWHTDFSFCPFHGRRGTGKKLILIIWVGLIG